MMDDTYLKLNIVKKTMCTFISLNLHDVFQTFTRATVHATSLQVFSGALNAEFAFQMDFYIEILHCHVSGK